LALAGPFFISNFVNHKGIIMNYSDCIFQAIQNAFDVDTPQELLPLTITRDAYMLAGLESDRMGCAAWSE
jgi:hypothetical protein